MAESQLWIYLISIIFQPSLYTILTSPETKRELYLTVFCRSTKTSNSKKGKNNEHVALLNYHQCRTCHRTIGTARNLNRWRFPFAYLQHSNPIEAADDSDAYSKTDSMNTNLSILSIVKIIGLFVIVGTGNNDFDGSIKILNLQNFLL